MQRLLKACRTAGAPISRGFGHLFTALRHRPRAYDCATFPPLPRNAPSATDETAMDMRINSSLTTPLTGTQVARRITADRDNTPGVGFGTAFKNALQEVSGAQNQASALQREVQLDNPSVSIEETMVAMQKAQIGFQATLNVRNRMVQAYTDIMNMQV